MVLKMGLGHCMMWPRLKLLKELLTENGTIWIAIDDIEVHRLRLILDEVFGQELFLGQFVWKSRQNIDNRNLTGASIDHEYVLCYGSRIRGSERKREQYSNPDNDPRGPWASGNMVGLLPEDRRPNCHYDITDPQTGIVYPKPALGWRYDRETMQRLITEDRIIWPATADGRPRRKLFLEELNTQFTGFSSIVGQGIYTRDGTADVKAVFGRRAMEFPKPVVLLEELIVQGCPENGLILDSFAGSGTTAHAVLKMNAVECDRKFILVGSRTESMDCGFVGR